MEAQSESTRLVADAMLGRLAKWLRLLGYDTRYDNDANDVTLLRIAQAEDRVLLTRDWALSRRRGVRAIWIESQELQAQIRQVRSIVGPLPEASFTRCALCNERLELIDKAKAEARVPAYVFRTQDEFRCCPHCQRIYWAATHVARMREVMDSLSEG